ncbi:MAG: SBBP repeat-containing protein [Isosphaeraceae bacterium]
MVRQENEQAGRRSLSRRLRAARRNRRDVRLGTGWLEERVLLSGAGDSIAAIDLPLSFEANLGQSSGSVQFLARGQGYGLALSDGEAELSLRQSDGDTATVFMTLVGARPDAAATGDDLLPGKVNYFLGDDPSAWITDVPTFARVKYQDVYPGVDLVYYGNQGRLEYDFVVDPYVDPSPIAVRYGGINGARLDASGNLILAATGGDVVVHRPILYQTINGVRHDVAGRFDLRSDSSVGFVVGAYDRSQPLVIDPILVYSTYFGGSGDDRGNAVAVDSQGAAYFTGSTLSTDLATTSGALAPNSFISEVFRSSNGGANWSGTGSSLPDANFSSVIVDPTNPAIVYAASSFTNSYSARGIYRSTDGGLHWTTINNGLPDLDITKLVMDPTTPSTLYTIAGNFIFKSTDSGANWTAASTGLPTGIEPMGLAVAKSNPQVLYTSSSSYLYKSTNGGASWSKTPAAQLPLARVIVVDPNDANVVYVGATKGVFFTEAGGVYKSTNGGNSFTPTGLTSTGQFSLFDLVMDPTDPSTLYEINLEFSQVVLRKTTNGGASWSAPVNVSNGVMIAVAPTPGGTTVYVASETQGVLVSTDGAKTFNRSNLGVANVVSVAASPSSPSNLYAFTPGRPRNAQFTTATDAFVAKLNPAGTALEYVTYLGGPGQDVGQGIAVDAQGNAYVGGQTIAGGFPTTPGAFQPSSPSALGRYNGFVTKLNPTGSALIYSTYLAGTSGGYSGSQDQVRAVAVDGQGRVAVAGIASSSNFPTTTSGYDRSLQGIQEAFVSWLDASGSSLLYSTLLGGSNDLNAAYGIAFDAQGNLHVSGTTDSIDPYGRGPTNFPTTGSAYQSSSSINRPGSAFYAKINPNASGAASLLYSTVFGGSEDGDLNTYDNTEGAGIAVDGQGRAFIVGNTLAHNLPTRRAYQSAYAGDNTTNSSLAWGDGFLAVFDASLSGDASLIYSTYLGGSGRDAAYGVAIDPQGNALVTGTTASTDFPSRQGLTFGGTGRNAFLARFDISQSGNTSLVETSLFGGLADQAEARGVAVDSQGNVYFVGTTAAANFAVLNPAQGAYKGGTDAFIAKLTPSSSSTDLSVTVVGTPDPVTQGEQLTLTITVRNNSSTAVANAFLSDLLDVNDTFVSASITPASVSGRYVNFALGALAAGASTEVRVVVKVGAPPNPSLPQNVNVATVFADRVDFSTANNTATAGTLLRQKSADLALSVAVEEGSILQGVDFTYLVTVANQGPDDATGVVLDLTMPTNAIYKSATPAPTATNGQTRQFVLGDIPAGTSRVIRVFMTPLGLAGDSVYLKGQVAGDELEPDASNNSFGSSGDRRIVSTPDQANLALALTRPGSIVDVGDHTFTATVTNQGPHIASNVVLRLESTLLFPILSITPSQGTASQANNVITAKLGDIPLGGSATVTFVVRGDTDGVVFVKGTVKADESDPDPYDNTRDVKTKIRNGSLIFVVSNTNDSGPGSLREALANSESEESTIAIPNRIVFNIPESDPGKDPRTGAFVIRPLSELPAIFSPVIIDGYTQPGASPNTAAIDQPINAVIRIEIDGSLCERPSNGLSIYAHSTQVHGLAINSFVTKLQRGTTTNLLFDGAGIWVHGSDVVIAGNFLGTDASGTIARANEVMAIAVWGSNTLIGGTDPSSRNLISGNGAAGIGIASTVGNTVIIGNFVGTDRTGARGLPTNLRDVAGLRLASSGMLLEGINARVGGTTAAERNVISGNADMGIGLLIAQSGSSSSSATRSIIIGNFIGTDLTGTRPVPNGGEGIRNESGVYNTIGGTTAAERNIISGNAQYGVSLADAANVVKGNYIGTDVTGLLPLGNGAGGVLAQGAGGTIGGTEAGAGNLIAGNNADGIRVTYNGYTIQGNSIGLDAAGNPLGNARNGVLIAGYAWNSVGAEHAMGNTVVGNHIAFNLANGVAVTTDISAFGRGTGNAILGNSIHGNSGLEIDLGSDGVTANHAALVTADGPNHFQNYPILTSAIFDAGVTTIQGTLTGLANRDYTIQFFASVGQDPRGVGEAEVYLGQVTARTDASGLATFQADLNTADLRGKYVSVTATTPNPVINTTGSDTSEVSPAVFVTGAPPTVVDRQADLAVTGAVVTANPKLGEALTYTYTVANLGPDAAHTVVFTHAIPAGWELVSASATVGAVTASGSLLTSNLGTLAAGASATVTLIVTPTSSGTLTFVGSASTVDNDPQSGNNSALLGANVAPGVLATDLAVSMELLTPDVRLGDLILYKLTIANRGPRVATGIVLRDILPAGATWVAEESSGGFNGTTTRILTVGSLGPGDQVHAFAAIRSTVAGAITNSASITLNQTDSDTSNNTASLVTNVARAASVTVLAASPRQAAVGANVDFPVQVTSPAGGQPTGTVVFRKGSTALDTKNLNASGAASFNTSTLGTGVHTIIAEYSGDGNFAPSAMPVTVTVGSPAPSADLNVRFQGLPATITAGNPFTLSLIVTNAGPLAATGVSLAYDLTGVATFGTVSTSLGSIARNGNRVTADLGDLAPGATAQITINLTPTIAGLLDHAANVSSGTSDPNTVDNDATARVTVVAPSVPNADLRVSVTPSASAVAQGYDVTFTVVVTNDGPDTAQNVTLTNTLPAGTTLVSTSLGTEASGVITASLGDLAPGASRSLVIVVKADAAGGLTNLASVQATAPTDLDTADNTASANVTANAPATLSRTLDLVFGTLTPAAGLGYGPRDVVSVSGLISTEIFNAILAQPNLDPRLIAGLIRLRDAAPTNPSSLGFFTSSTSIPQVSADTVRKPAAPPARRLTTPPGPSLRSTFS